ncbi:hypothetical protein [Streptacidiphilus sp. P02-A3a]|uniref:hypothetical protein n=1 Tax=Streptacidiphilus sp. P02-A3a TaxID=2704468 RepID=UPI0015F85D5B|nr:hypothetical protein [Streptacidiphilus sp. P02-A3a]QMU73076.1 hypothetical protein GXP74_37390 [Streptacidiphilus sp. P02-A3a]
MSRSLRRGAVAALIIATAPVLAACSAGDGAASLQVKPNAAATTIGSTLKLNGITVVTATNGSNTANVVANIANNSSTTPETLTSVSVDGNPATLSGPAVIPPLGSLLVSGPGQVTAQVASLSETPGQNATVNFTFANAGSTSVQALVNAGAGDYATYAPAAPTPPPVATLSPLPSPSGSTPVTGKTTGKTTAKTTAKASISATP